MPEKKITPEDVKYILSSYYQGTPYNPYQKADDPRKGIYRPIGISRTGITVLCQIRGYMPKELQGIEWITYSSNAFNAMIPLYTNVTSLPKYISEVALDVSTENFYWASRLIGLLADPHYGAAIQDVERYQNAVACGAHRILNEYDAKMTASNDMSLCQEANEAVCAMARTETVKALNKLTLTASEHMKNGFSRADN